MSTTMTYDHLEPETREDIQARRQDGHPCGCHPRGQYWYICDWHDGYDDGVARMKLRGGL